MPGQIKRLNNMWSPSPLLAWEGYLLLVLIRQAKRVFKTANKWECGALERCVPVSLRLQEKPAFCTPQAWQGVHQLPPKSPATTFSASPTWLDSCKKAQLLRCPDLVLFYTSMK